MSLEPYNRWLELIDAEEFRQLFIEELGWSIPKAEALTIEVQDVVFTVNPVAEYRGIRVWSCPGLPSKTAQRAIDAELRRYGQERLVVYHSNLSQDWKWPISGDAHGRGQGRLVSHEHRRGHRTESLLQRLALIQIGLEETPSVVEVVSRLRKAFDAEKITKTFYKRFSDEAEKLGSEILGVGNDADREWYSALLMNRLMFIYFMQRKGFMDGDIDYLSHRLLTVQTSRGRDRFYEFYADFLLPLFHDGLGSAARPVIDTEMAELIGDVPYVNGGIFNLHPLEASNRIRIPDSAFESIFRFFDSYQWHLDDRPSGSPTEINPDVLGYIFEQFINNKEQGAYYTKDDVTYFMTSSVLIPEFLERLQAQTGVNPWLYVSKDPERYIWESLGHGAAVPLPENVHVQDGVWPRPGWNDLADDSWGLPGESWWEVSHRLSQFQELCVNLRAGLVTSADEGVTSNLDLETLAIDVIDGLDSPEDVLTAWKILTDLKIVDPTCGSGAFLFAALKILEVLYETILDSAARHLVTAQHFGLGELLVRAEAHPSRAYFVLKHATLSNIYGVDLMREAVEIARLRLFLKLVSAVARREDLEPLPDLDFNIKAGNTLVGAFKAEALGGSATDLFPAAGLDAVEAAGQSIANEYRAFQQASETADFEAVAHHKKRITRLLEDARQTVDKYFFNGIDTGRQSLEEWQQTAQPFHWFLEFPEVFAGGGFDIVVGNPPYVAKGRVEGYSYTGFLTENLPDIYAPCVERATQIVNDHGRFSMILPISAQFGDDFQELRAVLEAVFGTIWVSAYSRNPAALFSAGLGVRSTIVIGTRDGEEGIFATKTHRWFDEYRPALFECLEYLELPPNLRKGPWLRPTSVKIARQFNDLLNHGSSLGSMVRPFDGGSIGFKQTSLYWLSVFEQDPPALDLAGKATPQTQVGRLKFENDMSAKLALGILASKFALVWWYCTGDDFHVTQEGLKSTPIDASRLSIECREKIADVVTELVAAFPQHVMYTKYAGKWMGNFVLSEVREITDRIDQLLARELGYEDALGALEHAYRCVYKPTGERPGTLRESPFPGLGV